MPGGGPAGSTLGLLEYLSQSKNNADCVDPEDRYKFVDDLTALEIVNLLTIGMASHNIKKIKSQMTFQHTTNIFLVKI